MDACSSSVVNFSNNPVEVIESEYPLLIGGQQCARNPFIKAPCSPALYFKDAGPVTIEARVANQLLGNRIQKN